MSLKHGQKVKIRTFKIRPSHWNSGGSMDCFMGQTVTISKFSERSFRIMEDDGRWVWEHVDIESSDPNALFKFRKK